MGTGFAMHTAASARQVVEIVLLTWTRGGVWVSTLIIIGRSRNVELFPLRERA